MWLKSGGYIVIDHTEALVAIDVNTGKYVGKRDFEETVLKINLEAAAEAVRQIRLRDLGGIIILDFIDMERAEHRETGLAALTSAGRRQGAHQRAGDLRARHRRDDAQARAPGPPLGVLRLLPHLQGQRAVKSDATLAAEIFRKIRRRLDASRREVLNARIPTWPTAWRRRARGLERLQVLIGRKISVQGCRPTTVKSMM